MADTLERRSPLQPWAAQFARLPNSVAIVEEPLLTGSVHSVMARHIAIHLVEGLLRRLRRQTIFGDVDDAHHSVVLVSHDVAVEDSCADEAVEMHANPYFTVPR